MARLQMLIVKDSEGVWVERLPDEIRLAYEAVDCLESIIRREGSGDDGFSLVFAFSNGIARYHIEDEDYESRLLCRLESWKPDHAFTRVNWSGHD